MHSQLVHRCSLALALTCVATSLATAQVRNATTPTTPVTSLNKSGGDDWTGFRGYTGTNISAASGLPLHWSDDSVTWRSTTPAFGQSSPVIWGETVFLTSIQGAMKETLWVSALKLSDGTERWRRAFDATEQQEFNNYVSKAAPTPAVDADRLYVLFASGDLYGLNHDGETSWHRNLASDYGTFSGNHGIGGSVLRTPDAVVILLTRRTYSYLLAVSPDTGQTLWKVDREAGVAWSTPALSPDDREIVVSASGWIEGFDSDTGERLWAFDGLDGNLVPSPTVTDGLVIAGGLAIEANLALRRGRLGILDESDVAWRAGSGSNFASPFIYGECVYWVNPAGAARCLSPATGVVRWSHRLPGSTWATPLGYRDYVYFFTDTGVTQILRASADAPEIVSTNRLTVDAPVTGYAVVDDAIVFRAGQEVIRVGHP